MKLNVSNEIIDILENEPKHSGSKDYYEIEFVLSSEWDEFTSINAIFHSDDLSSTITHLIVDDKALIPNELIEEKTKVLIGVYADDGTKRKVSNLYNLAIDQGSYVLGAEPVPTPDIWSQYLALVTAKADEATASATTATIEANRATTEADRAAAELSNKADLVNGVIPESQLPIGSDEILEYDDFSLFPETGESNKYYIAYDTNKSYRWAGSNYVELSGGVSLGETSSTAHRGDHGKTAYEHATKGSEDNPHNLDSKFAGKSNTDHNHDGNYAPNSHNHDGSYSPDGHNHDGNYSPNDHDHNSVYSEINHNHDGDYAPSTKDIAKTDDFTLSLEEAEGFVRCNKLTTMYVTIPLNSSVAFPLNTDISIIKEGIGNVSIVATGGVTINSVDSNLTIADQYSAATLRKIAADTWYLIGALS